MDSVTQAALGAAVAGMIAGRKASPKVLVAGAMLGTVPDLDVLIQYGDPVSDMVKHRGFSHSLFVLFPLSFLLTLCWQRWRPTQFGFGHLWCLIAACLITHPLLDAFTAYGTQLLWPMPVSVAISSIFIIDPLYTLPLLLTLLAALIWRERIASLCRAGLIVFGLYLAWSVVALNLIEHKVEKQLVGTALEGQPVLVTPTPFNTVLWRIVVLDNDQYWEGLASLLDGNHEVAFIVKPRGHWPEAVAKPTSLQALETFTNQFVRYETQGNQLIATDLRLGVVDYLPFRFVFASKDDHQDWQLQPPVQLESPAVRMKHLPSLWLRLLGNQEINADLCHVSEACQATATRPLS